VSVLYVTPDPLQSNDVFYATRQPFDPGSPSMFALDDVLRGGALEPEPRASWIIRRLKLTLIPSAIIQADAQRVFLSQAGPRFELDLLQAGHHPSVAVPLKFFQNDEGDLAGSPSLTPLCALVQRIG
jgi:hypothetical protein